MNARDERVNEAFAAWQRRREALRDQSQCLQMAMRNYVEGKAPLPSDLSDDVRRLRAECDRLFQKVIDAMNDSARHQGQDPNG